MLLTYIHAGAGTWDSRASAQDMEAMWNHPSVSKEWSKSGEKRGKVRFSLDTETRPYLSRVELKVRLHVLLMNIARLEIQTLES